MRVHRLLPLCLLAAGVVIVSTGCAAVASAVSGLPSQHRDELDRTRAAVADVARHIDRARTESIDDYARWASEATVATTEGDEIPGVATVELIGFESYPDATHGDAVGALQFLSTVRFGEGTEPFAACYESEFDYWGVRYGGGSWDRDGDVARDIACPSGASRIAPPVDTRPIEVIPDGAEELVVEVLGDAPANVGGDAGDGVGADADPDVAPILAEIEARMPQPTGEREVAFTPSAEIRDGDIGVAMGDADDCLLVARTSSGVNVIHAPRVLLQPGELGCRPGTALASADALRDPH